MQNFKLPKHLDGETAQGLEVGEPIAQYEIGPAQNFVYLILDWATKNAAIVDPQKDLNRPLADLEKQGFELTTILLTHSHWDHTAGVVPLLKKWNHLAVRVGEADAHRLPQDAFGPGYQTLKDGEEVKVGSLSLRAIHTPGHSAGEFCFYLASTIERPQPYLFTGDLIFIRDCGRTDFEDGSNEDMFKSLQKVKALPPETVFLVGHHYATECSTYLGAELERSAPFRCNSVEELAQLP